MSSPKSLVSGSLWCVLDGWASEFANLAIFLIMVRLLGPEEFGLVAIALVFTSIGTELFGYSVSQVLIQRPHLSAGMQASVFWLVVALIGSLALGLVLAAPLIAAAFDAPELVWLLRWLCLAAFIQGIAAVPLALLTRRMRFDVIAKRSLAMIAVGGTIGIGLAAQGHGVVALVGLHLGQASVSALILFRAARFRPALRVARAHLAEVRSYVLGVVGNRIVGLFDERAAQFVIGLVLGPAAVGYYNVAMRLIDILIRMFVVPVNQVALPAIAQLKADPARVRGILSGGIAITGLTACPAFLGTAVMAPELIPLALGEVWLPTALVLQILCLRGLVWPVVLYGQSLLFGLGQPGRLLRINLIDLAVNVATLVAAAPFGLVAVALASSLRILLIRWPLIGRAIGHVAGLGLRRQAALLAPALLAAGLMSGVLLIWREFLLLNVDPVAAAGVLVAGGALIYGLTVLLVFPGLAHGLRNLAVRLIRPRPGPRRTAGDTWLPARLPEGSR